MATPREPPRAQLRSSRYVYPLTKLSRTLIGRRPDADVVLEARSTNEDHAVITFNPRKGYFQIEDNRTQFGVGIL